MIHPLRGLLGNFTKDTLKKYENKRKQSIRVAHETSGKEVCI